MAIIVPYKPELGRFPGEGNATRSSFLAWRIAWTEEPGGLQVHGGHKESGTTERPSSAQHS